MKTKTIKRFLCIIVLSAAMSPVMARQRIPVPDMTYRERIYLPADSTAEGLLVYQTDGFSGFYHYDGKAWHALSAAFYRHKAIVIRNLMLEMKNHHNKGKWMIKRPNRLKP
ncbi:MAG: hypothetical protein K2H70_00950 [Bacteroidales bacterium]|nr:hypothetical protein [Bacteroidales bacterium]